MVTERAQNIVDNFKPPEKLANNVVLTYEVEDEKTTYIFTDLKEMDGDIKRANNLDRDDVGYISDKTSQMISEHHEKDERYSLHPVQRSYSLIHRKTKEAKKFMDFIMEPGWIHNLERFRKPNLAFLDSLTFIENGRFVYDGMPTEVEFNTNDLFETLSRIKKKNGKPAFKELKSKPEISHGCMSFDSNDESSARSDWDGDGLRFVAYSYWPAGRDSDAFAVFGRTKERAQVEKIEIAKREYQALLQSSRKLMELKPIVDDLNSRMESIRNVVA